MTWMKGEELGLTGPFQTRDGANFQGSSSGRRAKDVPRERSADEFVPSNGVKQGSAGQFAHFISNCVRHNGVINRS